MYRRFFLYCLVLIALVISQVTGASEPHEFQKSIVRSALHQSGLAPQSLVTIQNTHTVRMVVFTTYDGYQLSDGKLAATIWATVEPELKERCSQYVKNHQNITHEQLSLWITQLLGLPTKQASERRFVILDLPVIQAFYGTSAQEIGIFRPCTDPRIGPHLDDSPICPMQMNRFDDAISSAYKTWFINNSLNAHTLKDDVGAPWSEYGYTYNWNPEAENIYGVSEFVVLKNTPINRVVANPLNPSSAYVSAEDYCGVK